MIKYLIALILIGSHIDARYLSNPSKALSEDIMVLQQLPENANRAGERISDSFEDVVDTAYKTWSGAIELSEVNRYYNKVKTAERQRALEKQRDDVSGTIKINKMLLGSDNTAEQVQYDLTGTVFGIQDSLGVPLSNRGDIIIYDGGESIIKGFADSTNHTIGFNIGRNGVNLNNGAEIWEIAVHESAHTFGEDEKWAHFRSAAAHQAWTKENHYNQNITGQQTDQLEWLNDIKNNPNNKIDYGTQRAKSVQQADPFIPPLMLLSAATGAGLEYTNQVFVNRLDGKSWSDSLTSVNGSDIVIAAGSSAVGFGLAGAADHTIKAVKLGRLATMGSSFIANTSVDASISAGSQYLKEGTVRKKDVTIDTLGGIVGYGASTRAMSKSQKSNTAMVLHRQADRLGRIANNANGRQYTKTMRATNAQKKADNYGTSKALVKGAVASNATSKLLSDHPKKLVGKVKKVFKKEDNK